MEINGDNIKFPSPPGMYLKEKYGKKPNVVRQIPDYMFDVFVAAFKGLKTITIVQSQTGETFTREITDISAMYLSTLIEDELRVTIDGFVFSWKMEITDTGVAIQEVKR